jgi:hypothetical protein
LFLVKKDMNNVTMQLCASKTLVTQKLPTLGIVIVYRTHLFLESQRVQTLENIILTQIINLSQLYIFKQTLQLGLSSQPHVTLKKKLTNNQYITIMKKIILILVAFLSFTFCFSQKYYTIGSGSNTYTVTVGQNAKNFFNSYGDYLANKPVEGIKLIQLNSSSVKISEKGSELKVKASKLQYNWFCDEYGILMRIFEGDIYYVIVDGPFSFYINRGQGTVVKDDNSKYHIVGELSDSYPSEYYSLTPNGSISKLKESVLEEYLEKYSLLEDYKEDPAFKRERKDCVMCWQNKKTNKQIKYIKILNTKLK